MYQQLEVKEMYSRNVRLMRFLQGFYGVTKYHEGLAKFHEGNKVAKRKAIPLFFPNHKSKI